MDNVCRVAGVVLEHSTVTFPSEQHVQHGSITFHGHNPSPRNMVPEYSMFIASSGQHVQHDSRTFHGHHPLHTTFDHSG